MHAILTVFSKEFRENLRDRRTLFTALIFGPLFAPLLFAAVLSLMIQRTDTQQDQPLALAIAHAERAPNLVNQFVAYGVTVVPVSYEDADARAAVQRHEHKLILMVPEDYATFYRDSFHTLAVSMIPMGELDSFRTSLQNLPSEVDGASEKSSISR